MELTLFSKNILVSVPKELKTDISVDWELHNSLCPDRQTDGPGVFVYAAAKKSIQDFLSYHAHIITCTGLAFSQNHHLLDLKNFEIRRFAYMQGSTLSFLAGRPKSHFLGWYRNFLVYWYLKLDNQVVNSTCPKDKLGWIWRADDP